MLLKRLQPLAPFFPTYHFQRTTALDSRSRGATIPDMPCCGLLKATYIRAGADKQRKYQVSPPASSTTGISVSGADFPPGEFPFPFLPASDTSCRPHKGPLHHACGRRWEEDEKEESESSRRDGPENGEDDL
uniref:Uncharacterized protein n=1 Tax=Pristionchus pacificus TaxID=54126 RepID=A0A2A6CSN7_PRIPA|eukprot:PDM81234.1 hypothetical protein PRIPAC_36237 [Pristionchus pacificus]